MLPSISVRNRTVYAAMMNKKTWDIEFTEGHSANNVYKFDKPIRVNNDAGNWHYAPSLAVDYEKNVCIAWLDARNGNYDIYFSHGTKENGIWRFGKNMRVNYDSTNVSHYTPSLAFENGSAYIAWYDDRNKDFDIYFSTGRFENDSGDIYFSDGKYDGKTWVFSRNTKINDNLTDSFTKPDPIFLGLILVPVIVSVIIVGFLKKYEH